MLAKHNSRLFGIIAVMPGPTTTIVGRELLRRVADGDEQAFRELFEAFTPKLKTFFRKWTKDATVVPELVQETFLNIWLYRSALLSVEHPDAYVYKIAANVASAWFRKADLDRQLLQGFISETSQVEDTEMVSLKELQHHLENAIQALPPQQQQVFRLSREQGLTRREIASRMHLSENSVRNYMAIALASVQAYMQQHHNLYIPLFFLQMLLHL